MKVVYVLALVVLALVCFAGMAQGDQTWVEQRITNTDWYESAPRVWGDTVYYSDFRSGAGDIYRWDPVGGSRPVLEKAGSQVVQSVYEDKVLYRDRGGVDPDLYIWDPVHGDRLISDSPGDQNNASMYGDIVVWEDRRTEKSQVYIWDPVGGERPLSPYPSTNQRKPRIWGDTVVWEDGRNGRCDVYMWNPRDGERLLSTYASMCSPAIYHDRVVMWMLYDPYSPIQDSGLWEWTPAGGLRWRAKAYPEMETSVQYTQLWGDTVVYQGGTGPSNIGVWDPVHGFRRLNQSASGNAMTPSLRDDRIAWIGGWDLYLSTLVPEPSGLLVLAAASGLVVAFRRKRT